MSKTEKTLKLLADYRKRKASGTLRLDRVPTWLAQLQAKRRAYAVAKRAARRKRSK